MKKMYLIAIFIIISSVLLAGPSQPFGPNPKIGQTYGYSVIATDATGIERRYLHEAVDIHTSCSDSIFAIDAGFVSRNWSGNTKAGPNDEEVHIGGIIYGHIDSTSIPKAVRYAALRGLIIPVGTYIGKASCGASGSNWSPHIHLVFGDANYAYRNPLGILDSVYGLGCGYFDEDITDPFAGLIVSGHESLGETQGTPPVINGGIKIQAFSRFETTLGPGRGIAPYQVKWGVDESELGFFSFNGTIPRKDWNSRVAKFNQIHTEGIIWDLTKMAGSNEQTADFTSLANGYWNTRQSTEDSIYAWNDTTNDPCDINTRKFPDGPHKVWVWATTYCGTPVADTIDVIIDNNPPQAEASKDGTYSIKIAFTEPMDTSTFDGNININILCHYMGQASYDSISFSEDLTELTLFMPDTFASNEAYHVELTNDITDIAGTSLDGNANCQEEDSDNYKKIVGVGNCNHAFIIQNGGSTTGWNHYEDYQDCVSEHDCWYCGRFNNFGGPNGWSLRGDAPYSTSVITVSGMGAVFPYNNWYSVQLVGSIPEDKYVFTVNKTGNTFAWQLTMNKNDLDHYNPCIRVNPNTGADYYTGFKYIGYRHVYVYRYDFTCGSGLTVIDTSGESHSVQQQDAIYQFENGLTVCNIGGFTGRHATYSGSDDNPIITPVGDGRAKVYSGFSGPSTITLLKSGGTYPYNGGCGSGAPRGMYTIADGSYQMTAPYVRPPIMNFDVSYGALHDIAIALGMPASVTIGEGGSSRPSMPEDDPELQKEKEFPEEYSIGTPRPNPFNTAVSFDIELPTASIVDVRIYDIMGRLVDNPIERAEMPSGRFTETWKCEDCPSGTYFIALSANEFHQTRKVTMVK